MDPIERGRPPSVGHTVCDEETWATYRELDATCPFALGSLPESSKEDPELGFRSHYGLVPGVYGSLAPILLNISLCHFHKLLSLVNSKAILESSRKKTKYVLPFTNFFPITPAYITTVLHFRGHGNWMESSSHFTSKSRMSLPELYFLISSINFYDSVANLLTWKE